LLEANRAPASTCKQSKSGLGIEAQREAIARFAGRNVIVRAGPDGTAADITPAGFNVRTRAHEYGGGSWLVAGGTWIFSKAGGTWIFSNFADQRLYRQRAPASPTLNL
jgi:hypothetical protein